MSDSSAVPPHSARDDKGATANGQADASALELDEERRSWVREGIESSRSDYVRNGDTGAALQAHRLARSIGEPTPDWALSAVLANHEQARGIVSRSREEFFATGNPMYAWQAYLEARSIEDPPPEWVLSYIDEAANIFWRSFQGNLSPQGNGKSHNRPDDAFAIAFGIKKPKIGKRRGKSGRGTVWCKFADRTWLLFGLEVMQIAAQWAEKGYALKESQAVKEVVQNHNRKRPDVPVSFSVVWRAWAQYKRRRPHCISELAQLAEAISRRGIRAGQPAPGRFGKSPTF